MEKKPLKPAQVLRPPALPKKYQGRFLPESQLAAFGRYSQLSLAHEQFIGQIAERVSFDQMLIPKPLHALQFILGLMRMR